MDAVAQLSGAIRRLADEPNSNRRALAALNELLAANYLLASDFSTMPVLMQVRGKDLDVPVADHDIAEARQRVLAMLAPGGTQEAENAAPEREPLSGLASSDLPGNQAMTVLARRVRHIEHAARKVARLAARPVIEDNPVR